jgi:hypothetical protein
MSGLLRKAADLRRHIRKKLSPGDTDSRAEQISREKNDEVMAEMDAILESNRLKITEETLAYTAQSSGALFPVLINLGAFLLLVGLGALFIWYFDQTEKSITSGTQEVISAEGRIIEAVRRASEEELSRKEDEIDSIQNRLQEAEASQAALIAETEEELSRREALLREELAAQLELERQRLSGEGLSESAVEEQLALFEARKRTEFEEQLASMSSELEARMAEQEAQLNSQIDSYRASLASAREEQDEIRAKLEEELAAARSEAATAAEEATAETSAALAELEALGRRRQEEKLVQDQILAVYDDINQRLSHKEYDQALDRLDSLESYLNQASVAGLPSVAERLEIEEFLISSLRQLIDSRRNPGDRTAPLLSSVSLLVEEGNALYEEGNTEAARENYLAALRQIPGLETGYSRLREIEQSGREEERTLLAAGLSEGDRLYRGGNYHPSVERYREALRLMEIDAASADRMVDQLMEAGYRLRRDAEPAPEPVIIPGKLSPEDQALVEQAKSVEEQRQTLVNELRNIRDEYRKTSVTKEPASQDALIALLNTKLLIRQALAEESVREEYPDLYRETESVFEAYGELQRIEGRTEALEEIVSLTKQLAEGNEAENLPLSPAEESRQQELLLQFLENLEELLGAE